jgi:ornithine carbamoyltransferase
MPNGQQSLEATNDVLESTAAIGFDRAEIRLSGAKTVLVATLGS